MKNVDAILKKAKNRAIRNILTFKDEECDEYLPDDVADDLRFHIMNEFNGFFTLATEVAAATEQMNQYFLEIKDAILSWEE